MASTVRSVRQEQREVVAGLRAKQRTWTEIANVFCERYGVNMRAALRMVRDWSQRDAADQWNMRWPDEPKTFKNFSYWEVWPSPTGHAPSLDVLSRLAEMYECRLADLVADCADYRERDTAFRDGRRLAQFADFAKSQADPGDLISALHTMDVPELARLTASWAHRLGAEPSRRALLLKLSAGLSLAAASPAIPENAPPDPAGNGVTNLAGIWHSKYVYPSTGRKSDFVGEHYVVLRQQDTQLIARSLPHSTGSRLTMELGVQGHVATGSWREETSPEGYYKGAVYHGTTQLVVEPSGRRMRGMWVGFGRDFTINSGQWELTWQEGSTTTTAQRRYHNKL